jgi:hypothetical protein
VLQHSLRRKRIAWNANRYLKIYARYKKESTGMDERFLNTKKALVIIRDKQFLETTEKVLKKRGCEITRIFKRGESFDLAITDSSYAQHKLMDYVCTTNWHTPVFLVVKKEDQSKVPSELQGSGNDQSIKHSQSPVGDEVFCRLH